MLASVTRSVGDGPFVPDDWRQNAGAGHRSTRSGGCLRDLP